MLLRRTSADAPAYPMLLDCFRESILLAMPAVAQIGTPQGIFVTFTRQSGPPRSRVGIMSYIRISG